MPNFDSASSSMQKLEPIIHFSQAGLKLPETEKGSFGNIRSSFGF